MPSKSAIQLFGMCFDPSQPVIIYIYFFFCCFFLRLTGNKDSTKMLISDATQNIDFYVMAHILRRPVKKKQMKVNVFPYSGCASVNAVPQRGPVCL